MKHFRCSEIKLAGTAVRMGIFLSRKAETGRWMRRHNGHYEYIGVC